MNVYWTPQALQDSEQTWDYLVEKNPDAAVKIDDMFIAAVDRLSAFPLMDHEGEISGTREVYPHQNYRLVYQIEDNAVWVLALVHISQCWPKTL